MTTQTAAAETMNFEADVSRLLDIVANALYSHHDVFLRELISNAADACDRLRYEAVKTPVLIAADPEFRIRVFKDTKTRTLTVADNGIGMNRQDLIDNLGTIARSGTAALMAQMKQQKESGGDGLSLIGQFGVGFYASFMVADRVEVVSRKAGEPQAWHWESDGRTGFSVREASAEESARLESGRGVAIVCHIKPDGSDFLIDEKIKLVIQRYSDHINFPIFLGEKTADEKPVNAVSAIWTRPRAEVTPEQYNEFYKHITLGFDDPLLTAHWKAEGTIEYSALLYIPTMRPWDLYDPSRKHAVKLYVRRVFITEQCDGLVYPWLRFLRGVIDSADLPLNISREMLQFNPVIAKIRVGVARRVLGDLAKLSQDDPAAFRAFWGQFGSAVKEGLYDAPEVREDILKITRFYSTHGNGKELVSLDEYVSRMKDGQDAIYYISGENLDTLVNSPQTEGFKARGLEVLFMTDTIDDFWLQAVPDHKQKPFKSITKGAVDLGRFKPASGDDAAASGKPAPGAEKILARMAEILKDEVETVRASERLTDSPVCLIASESGVDMRMERSLRIHQKYDPKAKRVLEINPSHPLIAKLERMAEQGGADGEIENAAFLLLDQARIIQGEPVQDPSAFAKRMSRFMERGL